MPASLKPRRIITLPQAAMPDAVHSSLSLRYRLPLIISALLCLVVASLIWLGHRQIQRVLLDTTSTRLTTVTQNLTGMFEQSVTRLASDARQFARDSNFRRYLSSPDNPTARLNALRALETNRQLPPLQTISVTLTSADRGHSISAGNQPTPSRRDAGANTSIPVIHPLPDSITISPLLSTDSGVVYRVQVPVVGPSFDTIGYLTTYRRLGSAQGAEAVGKLIGSDASLLLGNSAGDLWTDIAKTVPGPPTPPHAGELTRYRSATGDAMIGVAVPVRGSPWTAWIQEPLSTVLAPARTFLLSMTGLALLVVLGGGIVAWLVSQQLTAPLADVSRAAEDVARGDYGRRVAVKRQDELGSLASSFNTMAAQVETSSHELQRNAAALKSANYELRESEHRYRQLVELLPDAVIVHRDGNIVLANPAALTLFGTLNSGDVIAESLNRFVPGSVAASNGTANNANGGHLGNTGVGILNVGDVNIVSATSGNTNTGSATDRSALVDRLPLFAPSHKQVVQNLNGGLVNAESTSVPFTHDGQPAELMILRDVSERERLEERFRQAQKMEAVGQLAGGVAHDFNNLLTVVTSYSALLLANLPKDSGVRGDVQEIANAADRAAALTRQLLAFSRQQVLEARVIDLNQIVRDMEKMLRRIIPSDIVLVPNLSPTLGNICADPGQLEQVLMNLVVNARDAMPRGGTLQLETAEIEIDESDGPMHSGATPGTYVLLVVSDTGCGMTAAQQARIFDPFFTTKPPGQGTGLGLSTVYGIVKQSGGFIWVYSELNQGTVFRVYLPKVAGSLKKGEGNAEARANLRGKETVLLVEDEPSVRKTARRVLEGSGYTVIEAAGGREALEVCAKHVGQVDVLLTDMVMPEMSGRELAERFHAKVPLAPVIFMSGYTEDTVLRQSAAEPGAFFVQKPFTPQTLTQKIRQAIDAGRTA